MKFTKNGNAQENPCTNDRCMDVLMDVSIPASPHSPTATATVQKPEAPTDSQTVSQPDDQIDLFTKEQADDLEKTVADAFQAVKGSRARQGTQAEIKKASEYLRRTAEGETWRNISKALKMEWVQISMWSGRYKGFCALRAIAKACGDEIRQIQREEEADRRGKEGWLEPVFWNGKKQGTIRRYSDKLLEIQMKANNPAKYGEKATGQQGATGGGIVLNISGVVLGQQPKMQDFPPCQDKDPLPNRQTSGILEGQIVTETSPNDEKDQKQP